MQKMCHFDGGVSVDQIMINTNVINFFSFSTISQKGIAILVKFQRTAISFFVSPCNYNEKSGKRQAYSLQGSTAGRNK